MSVIDRYVRADAEISDLALAALTAPAAVAGLAQRLAKAISALMVTYAHDLNPEDVHVWRAGHDVVMMTTKFSAIFAPDPMRGIEFLGGSHDGEIMPLPRSEGPGKAFPVSMIRVMAETQTMIEGQPAGPLITDLVEDYERIGIDLDKRRFMYRIKVTK